MRLYKAPYCKVGSSDRAPGLHTWSPYLASILDLRTWPPYLASTLGLHTWPQHLTETCTATTRVCGLFCALVQVVQGVPLTLIPWSVGSILCTGSSAMVPALLETMTCDFWRWETHSLCTPGLQHSHLQCPDLCTPGPKHGHLQCPGLSTPGPKHGQLQCPGLCTPGPSSVNVNARVSVYTPGLLWHRGARGG